MSKISNQQIRRLLDLGFTAQVIAMNHNLTPRRVQRIATDGRSAHPDTPKPGRLAFRMQKGQHLAEQPSARYGEYWRHLKGEATPAPVKVRRTLHMVPDDRLDEAFSFDELLDMFVAGVGAYGRRSEGRGAA